VCGGYEEKYFLEAINFESIFFIETPLFVMNERDDVDFIAMHLRFFWRSAEISIFIVLIDLTTPLVRGLYDTEKITANEEEIRLRSLDSNHKQESHFNSTSDHA
jgi:hypothetical protein